MSDQEDGLISVVVASYNGERYLRAQLDSLLAQSYTRLEIILTDDCSTDGTRAILEEYVRKDPLRVRALLNETNLGFVGNFERGIRAARGDYLALCDQDDVWLPTKLERLKALLDEGASLAFCDLALVDRDLRPLGKSMWASLGVRPRDIRALKGTAAFEVLMRRNIINGCSLLVPRSVSDAALPFPPLESFVHDQWLALIAAFMGPIAGIPEKLVLYRQHPSQQTGAGILARPGQDRPSPSRAEAYAQGWQLLFGRLREHGVAEERVLGAEAWLSGHIGLMRQREGELDLRLALSYLTKGIYAQHFSGLKSFGRDMIRVLKKARFDRR